MCLGAMPSPSPHAASPAGQSPSRPTCGDVVGEARRSSAPWPGLPPIALSAAASTGGVSDDTSSDSGGWKLDGARVRPAVNLAAPGLTPRPPPGVVHGHAPAPSSIGPTSGHGCATDGQDRPRHGDHDGPRSQPDPGVYPVYAKDLGHVSDYGGPPPSSTGSSPSPRRGRGRARRLPRHAAATKMTERWCSRREPGHTGRFGASSGLHPAVTRRTPMAVWDHLAVGDEVHVIS